MIDYRDSQGVNYLPTNNQVWPVLPVCEYLKGSPWDHVALAAVSSLRPSSIRVITPDTDYVTSDSITWRVTVILDENNLVKSIEQEVQADVADNIQHGHDLYMHLRTRPNWPKL